MKRLFWVCARFRMKHQPLRRIAFASVPFAVFHTTIRNNDAGFFFMNRNVCFCAVQSESRNLSAIFTSSLRAACLSAWFAIRVVWRVFRLALTFGPLLLTYPVAKLHNRTLSWWWVATLNTVEKSGPTIVKLGQWASTRRDLFSPEFCDRFSKLHRYSQPHSWNSTVRTLNEVLGSGWQKELADFTTEPIGCGCVAQVYKAAVDRMCPYVSLRDCRELFSGKRTSVPVALKVIHPGILETVKVDLAVLRKVASFLEFCVPASHYLNPVKCVMEFQIAMEMQVDLRAEANSLRELSANFCQENNVVFPRVVFSSEKVLVETFEDGFHVGDLLTSAGKENPNFTEKFRKKVALFGVRALLKMIFVDNLVHGDLHPGNILVRQRTCLACQQLEKSEKASHLQFTSALPRFLYARRGQLQLGEDEPRRNPCTCADIGPQLVFLDTGIIARLSERDLKNFRALFRAVVRSDGCEVASLLLSQAPQQFCADDAAFKIEIAELVRTARQDTSLRSLEVSTLLWNLFSIVSRHKVELESNFTRVVLAVMVLEGLGRSLDPQLDVIQCAMPYLSVV